MPTTSELACSTATKTLARPSRMVIVCVMSVPHISLTLSLAHLGFQPGDLVVAVIALAFFQGCSRACERTLAPLGQPGDRDICLPPPLPAARRATVGRQSPSCAERKNAWSG